MVILRCLGIQVCYFRVANSLDLVFADKLKKSVFADTVEPNNGDLYFGPGGAKDRGAEPSDKSHAEVIINTFFFSSVNLY